LYSIAISNGITPEYFYYKICYDELEALIKKSEEDYINNWNQTRYVCYSIFQSQSQTLLQPTDILKFPWDKIEPTQQPKTKEELIKHSLEMEKKLNSTNV